MSNIDPVQFIVPEETPGSGAMLILRDGNAFRMILKVTPINIDHVDDEELGARLVAWGNLLDSLDETFPIQIMLHATLLDPDMYFRPLVAHLNAPSTTPEIKRNIKDHLSYVSDMIRRNNQLERSTFIVVPFGGVESPSRERLGDQIPVVKVIDGIGQGVTYAAKSSPTEDMIDQARKQLELRVNRIQTGLRRFGASAYPLNESEVLALLYEQYRERQAMNQRHRLQ